MIFWRSTNSATGGGAHKFADIWEQDLGIGMIKQDELNSLVAGMQFVLSTVVGECFTFRPKEDRIVDESVLTEENESLKAEFEATICSARAQHVSERFDLEAFHFLDYTFNTFFTYT